MTIPRLGQLLFLILAHLIIRYANTPAMATILMVQTHHSMSSRTRTGEEIKNNRLRLIRDHKSQCILYCIQ